MRADFGSNGPLSKEQTAYAFLLRPQNKFASKYVPNVFKLGKVRSQSEEPAIGTYSTVILQSVRLVDCGFLACVVLLYLQKDPNPKVMASCEALCSLYPIIPSSTLSGQRLGPSRHFLPY